MRLYSLVLRLLALPLIVYTLWQAVRLRDARYLRERLGFPRRAGRADGIWMHAASVGEVNAAVPLLHALHTRYPQLPLTLSTVTPTGARVAARRLPAAIEHRYLPLDWPGAVRRFLAAVQPRCALIMETELWPQLFRACAARGIPVLMINARLSSRTLQAPHWLCATYCHALEQVQAVLAKSAPDAERFRKLGAPAERVRTVGNIKYAPEPGTAAAPIELGRRYVLAASTHDDEELQLTRAWQRCANRARLLVIVPRHPQRLTTILQQLRPFTPHIAVRSRGAKVGPQTAIYIADTVGELGGFIAGAEFVFMGGSLVPRGGHNILEVARAGKAVLFGPHMHNFREEARLFLDAGAALQVADEKALQATLERLLHAPEQAQRLGARARDLLAERGRVLETYLEALAPWCEASRPADRSRAAVPASPRPRSESPVPDD